MLGIAKTAPSWKWAAFGKHPLAGDYFFAGPDDPLFQAFSGWVDNGYKKIAASRKNAADLYSWRFCGKGLTSGTLLCGIVRDNFDRHGRPYPLSIMGAGPLAGNAYDEQRALPIGEGQTISAANTVAAMSEALELTGREQVLEVGTGSGYQAAVLARLSARVVSIERHASLAAAARDSLQRHGGGEA